MPSLIPGYEYDIFISYRHKDNKGDHWVTEFVKALQAELDATFKEDISIYFDENPHDGLLETHDVDESLKDKLKCLIFIPIISQTYCDPKSFAWNHEFLAFKKLAAEDGFGLKVKLANGNVAGRVLPVKIHDLDAGDKTVLENELGGALRAVEFIYREPGVNRSLKPTDSRSENQNKTDYRNQVNKVANAVKDIVTALQNGNAVHNFESRHLDTGVPRYSRKKIFSAIAFVAFFILALFLYGYFYPPVAVREEPTVKRIAILPFSLIGDEKEGQYLADGMMEAILSHLSMFPELRVKSRTTVEAYRGTLKTLPEIASELKVDYILEGSAQKFGDDLRVFVKLIDIKTDAPVWSREYNNKFENIFDIQSEISRKIAGELKTKLTPRQLERIFKTPTTSVEAYNLYLQAREDLGRFGDEQIQRSIDLFKRAIALDPLFADAYSELGVALWFGNADNNLLENDSVLFYFQKAVELNPASALANSNLAAYYFYRQIPGEEWNQDARFVEAFPYLQRAMELNPNDPHPVDQLATIYGAKNEYALALQHHYKVLTMDIDRDNLSGTLSQIGHLYRSIGDMEKALSVLEILKSIDANQASSLEYFICLKTRDYKKALEQTAVGFRHDSLLYKATVYFAMKDFANAEKLYRQYFDQAARPVRFYKFNYVYALKKSGKLKQSKEELSKLKLSFLEGSDHFTRARIHILDGEADLAVKELQKVKFLSYGLRNLEINPLFEDLWQDQRFIDIIRQAEDNCKQARGRIRQMEKQGLLPDLNEVLEQVQRDYIHLMSEENQ